MILKNDFYTNVSKDIEDIYEIYKSSPDVLEKKHLISLITLKFLNENHHHSFEIPNDYRWEMITSTGINFGLKLNNAFKQLEQINPKLKGVFTITNFASLNDSISLFKVVDSILNRYSFAGADFEEMGVYLDQLWNVILYKEREEMGEFSSPTSITELLPRLLNKYQGDIYDGSSGLNGFLIETYKQANQNGGKVQLFGQEVNQEAWSLGIMNLLLRGLYPKYAYIQLGQTIKEPKWIVDEELMRFDGVITSPPFGMGSWGHEVAEIDVYGRFRYGIPGKSFGDMAFVLHSIASLKKQGKAIIVVSNGVLLRGGAEGKIRNELIKEDLIEAVISLPPKLHTNTSIPVSVLVINKNKPNHLINKVLVINAEECYEKRSRNRNTLGENNIEKIVNTYLQTKEIKNFSRLVAMNEIAINEWSIYPPRYFDKGKVKTKLGTFEISRKNYELSDVEKVSLQTLCVDISRGVTITKEESNNENPSHYLINLVDVQDGKINPDDLKGITLNSERGKEYELQPGDVILSIRGTSSKVVVIPDNDLFRNKLVYSSNFIRIRVNPAKANPYFIKIFLESPLGKYLLEFNQTGTVSTVLSHKHIRALPISVPPIEKQEEIANLILKAEKKYEEIIHMAQYERAISYHESYELMGISEAYEIIDGKTEYK